MIEFSLAVRLMHQRWPKAIDVTEDERFKQLDADGGGGISFAEFIGYHHREIHIGRRNLDFRLSTRLTQAEASETRMSSLQARWKREIKNSPRRRSTQS